MPMTVSKNLGQLFQILAIESGNTLRMNYTVMIGQHSSGSCNKVKTNAFDLLRAGGSNDLQLFMQAFRLWETFFHLPGGVPRTWCLQDRDTRRVKFHFPLLQTKVIDF